MYKVFRNLDLLYVIEIMVQLHEPIVQFNTKTIFSFLQEIII